MNDTINAETNTDTDTDTADTTAAATDKSSTAPTTGVDNTATGFAVAPPVGPPPPTPVAGPRPLLRNPNTRLGGVASGVAQYFGLDVSLVRLLFVVFTLIAGWGVLAYVAAWIIVPKADTWPPVEGSATSATP